MGELKKEMLPDPEVVEEVVEETPEPEPEVTDEPEEQEAPKPPKGYVPHEALAEERRMRKQAQVEAAEAEAKLNTLSSSEPGEEEDSDLETRLERLEQETVFTKYPNLEDKREEFEVFMEENTHYPLIAGAKIFLAENDMLEPKRKGLERPTAGPKKPPKSGLSIEDIQNLRENQPRKYMDMIQSGKIKFDDVNLD